MSLEESRKALNDALLKEGLEWKNLQPLVKQWWDDLKAWEKDDKFDVAFKDQRMTARQMNTGSTARADEFEVRNLNGSSRDIKLAKGVEGIQARTKPTNFFDPKNLGRSKNDLGLHDLSASLLDGSRPISKQLKRYGSAITLFMPLPMQEDLQLFYTLNQMGKTEFKGKDNNEIRVMRSQLTRVKLAQATDMHTSFVDISDPKAAKGKFRYGITGLTRTENGKDTKLDSDELVERRTDDALHYKRILDAKVQVVNEIVIAYRSHASTVFPMFAQWDDEKGHFIVVNADTTKPTGWIVTDSGEYKVGQK